MARVLLPLLQIHYAYFIRHFMKMNFTRCLLLSTLFASQFVPLALLAQCEDFSVSVNEPTFYTYCQGEPISLTVTAIGGTGPYTYQWSVGGSSPTVTVPAENAQYVVTVTDATGCQFIGAAHLKPIVADVNAFQSGSACEGEFADLVAFLSPDHDILWSTGETTQSILVNTPGTYSVTVTHPIYGCSAVDQVTPNFLQVDIPTIIGPASLCEGQNAILSTQGGPFFNFEWGPSSETSPEITVTSPGTYTVTVSNQFNCTATDEIEILPTQIGPPVLTGDLTICAGSSGNIQISNSSAFVVYQWNNGANSPSISINSPGIYSVTATDAAGCTASENIVVDVDPNSPIANPVPQPDFCGQGSGSINLVVSPPNGNTFFWANGMTTEDISDLHSGIYSVTVTSISGCTATAEAEIDNVPLQIAVVGNTMPNTLCTGGNGSIDLTVNPPGNYSFLWTNGEATEDLQNLPSGTYTVTLTLGSSCIEVQSFLVENFGSQINLNATTTDNSSCQAPNGAIDLNISPSGAFTFLWSNGATTEDLQNLNSGSYAVTVSSAGGCTTSASYVLMSNTVAPTTSVATIPANCGQGNGTIDLNVSPAGAYTFLWSNGATSEDLQNLAAGNYAVTVTTANGCTATTSATVASGNTSFSLAATPMPNTSCINSNGSIDLTTFPTGNYSFSWSNASTTEDLQNLAIGTYDVTVTANGSACTATGSYSVPENVAVPTATATATAAICGQANASVEVEVNPVGTYSYTWSNGSTASSLLDVGAGNFVVTITASTGCTSTASAEVLSMSNNFSLTALPTPNTSCSNANGAIDLAVSPIGSYTYTWSNGAATEDLQNIPSGNYLVTVTDTDACTATANFTVTDNSGVPILSSSITPTDCGQANGAITLNVNPATGNSFYWSSGEVAQNLQNVTAGSYAVTVTGSNGCSTTAALTVSNQSSNISIAGTAIANSYCLQASGAIDINISSAANYGVSWSNGVTTEDISGLPTGSYTVTVTDASGCSESASFTIAGPTTPQVAISGPINACEGTVVDLEANSGFDTYIWSNGATTSSIAVQQSSTYAVTVTDVNGCTASAGVVFQSLPLPDPNITGPSSICGGDAVFSVAGGNFNQITWSTGANTTSITVSQAALYSVTVDDVNGCSATASQALNVGISLVPTIALDTDCNGTATIDAGSGYANYLWSNGANSQSLAVATNGTYSVTVSDGTGCTGVATEAVTLLSSPQVQITGSSTVCQGSNAEFSVSGNFQQILWSTGSVSPNITVSQAAIYSVTVTDANGCTASDAKSLSIGAGLSPDISAMLLDCNGTFTLDAGSSWDTYLWSNGSTTASITVAGNGNYSVTVSDASGCTGSDSETVVPPTPPVLQIAGAGNICQGDETTLAVPGNFIQYLWSTGVTASQITISQGGTYGVTVSDANGCTASATWTVVQIQTDLVQMQTSSCSALDTGTVTVVLSNQFGCDSTVVTTTTLLHSFTTQITLSTCQGESMLYNGVEISAGNSESFHFTSVDGCDSLVQVQVSALPDVDFELLAEKTCPGAANGIIQVNMLSGAAPFIYAMNGAFQSSPSFQSLVGGEYSILVEDGNGCILEQSITVPESQPLEVFVQDDTLECDLGETTLRPLLLSGNPNDVEWTWPDGSHRPWMTVSEAGTYEVQIQDACQTIERSIQVVWGNANRNGDFFYIPNSFSPNGDGINDVFQVFPGQEVETLSFEFKVFDRWGNALFTAYDPLEAWDGMYRGAQMQEAVYVWFVKATVLACGGRLEEVFRKGDVTIIK